MLKTTAAMCLYDGWFNLFLSSFLSKKLEVLSMYLNNSVPHVEKVESTFQDFRCCIKVGQRACYPASVSAT